MKPAGVMWNLGCGRGGWSRGFMLRGWRCLGFDIQHFPEYPGEFIAMDVRELLAGGPGRFPRPDVIMASMPCDEFARWGMPWTRAKNPPVPSLELWRTCWIIADVLKVPIVQENVRAAQWFVGRATAHFGPFYLWGDVPAILPIFDRQSFRKKESYGFKERARRAEIPIQLSTYFGDAYAYRCR